jgi:hypothetical protein
MKSVREKAASIGTALRFVSAAEPRKAAFSPSKTTLFFSLHGKSKLTPSRSK